MNWEMIRVSMQKNRRQVLVVDDEPLVRELVITYLKTDGYAVDTAADGSEGLQKFKEGRFDLVITDQTMPNLTGRQLAAVIKRISPSTPIMMLTSVAPAEQIAGVEVILEKPVTLEEFRAAVRKII